MGYDLHIIRTKDWGDSNEDPVTWEQADALVTSDPELKWAKTATFTGGEPETTFVLKGDFIEWNGEPWFHWSEDQIIGGSRNEAAIVKLAQMAKALSARLVGDDGEEYKLERSFFGKLKVRAIPQ
jgi:hypothetical protein